MRALSWPSCCLSCRLPSSPPTGTHLSSLIANRDAVLLSALQIWREQQEASAAGRDTERQEKEQKDTQQLLTIVMRRAEKERQRADTSSNAKQQARPAASDAAHATNQSIDAPPHSPVSPQVTADEVEQLRHAYSSGGAATTAATAAATTTASCDERSAISGRSSSWRTIS